MPKIGRRMADHGADIRRHLVDLRRPWGSLKHRFCLRLLLLLLRLLLTCKVVGSFWSLWKSVRLKNVDSFFKLCFHQVTWSSYKLWIFGMSLAACGKRYSEQYLTVKRYISGVNATREWHICVQTWIGHFKTDYSMTQQEFRPIFSG